MKGMLISVLATLFCFGVSLVSCGGSDCDDDAYGCDPGPGCDEEGIHKCLEEFMSIDCAGDAIPLECAKIALDRGMTGPLIAPSSYFMKSPPEQFTDNTARRKVEAFIAGEDE